MSRVLDIVVTHYNEPWEVARPFFDMLGAQRSVDFSKFKIWFIQDGPAPSVFPSGYFVGSPLGRSIDNFEIVTIQHKGVSAARNTGLDRADSEWICFCDCDDSFSSIYSLKMLFYILTPEQPFDIMWNTFYMNRLDEDDSLILQNEYNHVWIHNKYYRLSFLREHDIRFCEELYMSEDSAFNNVAEMEVGEGRVGEIHTDFPLYAWVRRRGSITTDPERYYKNAEGHFERNKYVLGEYRKRKHDRASLVMARTVTDAYSMLTKFPENDESRRITERVGEFYRKERWCWKKLTPEMKRLALEASEKEVATLGVDIPGKPSLSNWIRTRLAREPSQLKHGL